MQKIRVTYLQSGKGIMNCCHIRLYNIIIELLTSDTTRGTRI